MTRIKSKGRLRYRRRRTGETDYRRRLKLLKSGQHRAVVRVSNTQVTCQLVKYDVDGDKVLVSCSGKSISALGWPETASNKSIPASYVIGYLMGSKAAKLGCNDAVLDIGLSAASSGSRNFAALKGMVDAGLNIPHDESVLPSEERINGEHINKSIAKSVEKIIKKIGGSKK